MSRPARLLIIGAGFSGTLLAIRLLTRWEVSVVLIERTGVFGRGVAYATTTHAHRLNVRSARMSAVPEDPHHFTRWLADHAPGEADPNGFARRALYGAYLSDTLRETVARAPGRLVRRVGEVTALETGDSGVAAHLSDGTRFQGEAAVLATGSSSPETPAALRGLVGSTRYVADPWVPGALSLLAPEDDLVLLGTGLTAVDALLAAEALGWTGRAIAVSRHGLLPRPHAEGHGEAAPFPPPAGALSACLRDFRRRAAQTHWSRLMDEIRPHGQAMWSRLTLAQKRRFLRHLRPWWDVHRHRLPQEIDARLGELRAQGRLEVLPANLVGARRQGLRVLVETRPRGGELRRTVEGAWVINCTGPAGDISRLSDPLIGALIAEGVARPDALKLGLDLDEDLHVRGADGLSRDRLFALGPLARGALWETMAVPDIRVQARDLAEALGRQLGATPRASEPVRAPRTAPRPGLPPEGFDAQAW